MKNRKQLTYTDINSDIEVGAFIRFRIPCFNGLNTGRIIKIFKYNRPLDKFSHNPYNNYRFVIKLLNDDFNEKTMKPYDTFEKFKKRKLIKTLIGYRYEKLNDKFQSYRRWNGMRVLYNKRTRQRLLMGEIEPNQIYGWHDVD